MKVLASVQQAKIHELLLQQVFMPKGSSSFPFFSVEQWAE
jgi:hypothetical protein